MNNKDLLKLLDGIQDDGKQIPLKSEHRILIIDAFNLFFRNFAVLNYINSQGSHIGGLGGFLRSLGSLVKQIQPTSVYIVFDGVGSTVNRKNLLPEYKSGRNTTKMTKELFNDIDEENEAKADQMSRLIHYLQCLPIKIISMDKVEADDVIAFLSVETTKHSDAKAFVISSDKDFFQLVNDQITVYAPMEKEFYTPKDVINRFGVQPYNFLTYKTLMGDDSDKIPGVKGLGDKKLKKLFPELFGDQVITLEDIFNICESKYDQHVIYSRVIFDFDQLQKNQKVMNLGNPMLDDQEKFYILNYIKESSYQLNIAEFLSLYHEDGLGNILKNVEYWVRDTWDIIDRYNKSYKNDITKS
jgi:5'-3' exonuclease